MLSPFTIITLYNIENNPITWDISLIIWYLFSIQYQIHVPVLLWEAGSIAKILLRNGALKEISMLYHKELKGTNPYCITRLVFANSFLFWIFLLLILWTCQHNVNSVVVLRYQEISNPFPWSLNIHLDTTCLSAKDHQTIVTITTHQNISQPNTEGLRTTYLQINLTNKRHKSMFW